MKPTPTQAILLAYPWAEHFGMALFFLTLAICVISTIEMLGTAYPFHVKCASIIGFTFIGFHTLKYTLAVILAAIMIVTGQWDRFLTLIRKDD